MPVFKDGRIAQMVEQLTLNQRVQGSSPCAPTKVFLVRKDLREATFGSPLSFLALKWTRIVGETD